MSGPKDDGDRVAPDGISPDRISEFTTFRKRMNERILAEPNQVVRRFFALDTQRRAAKLKQLSSSVLCKTGQPTTPI